MTCYKVWGVSIYILLKVMLHVFGSPLTETKTVSQYLASGSRVNIDFNLVVPGFGCAWKYKMVQI